ncbi:MAG: transcription elongation factor GreA [Candidatus Omnitrophica bacterium]|nr:transcription elongation factor GreA [Candidatus Omnitrophota bacterium]
MSERIRLTREGHNKLKAEYEDLTTRRRREIAKMLEHARAFGDLKENAEYDAAKNAQAHNEKRIADISDRLSRAELIDDSNLDKDKILIGASALLRDLENDEEFTYMIVSAEEADYAENKISISSPIGQTLLGHKVGDEVQIKVPAGVLKYKVLKISR